MAKQENRQKRQHLTVRDIRSLILLPGQLRQFTQDTRKFSDDMLTPLLHQAAQSLSYQASLRLQNAPLPLSVRTNARQRVLERERERNHIRAQQLQEAHARQEREREEAVRRRFEAKREAIQHREHTRISHVERMIATPKIWEQPDRKTAFMVRQRIVQRTYAVNGERGIAYEPMDVLAIQGTREEIRQLFHLMQEVAVNPRPIQIRTYDMGSNTYVDTDTGNFAPELADSRLTHSAVSPYMQTHRRISAEKIEFTRPEDHSEHYNPTLLLTSAVSNRQIAVRFLELDLVTADDFPDIPKDQKTIAHIVISRCEEGLTGHGYYLRLARYITAVENEMNRQLQDDSTDPAIPVMQKPT